MERRAQSVPQWLLQVGMTGSLLPLQRKPHSIKEVKISSAAFEITKERNEPISVVLKGLKGHVNTFMQQHG